MSALANMGNVFCQEKLDGAWSVLDDSYGNIFVGEEVFTMWHPFKTFHPFDIIQCEGVDVRNRPLWERQEMIAMRNMAQPQSGLFNAQAFMEIILARGGEGIVIKDLSSPFGVPWLKVKRQTTFDLIVTSKEGTWNLRLATPEGEDRGLCPARKSFDSIQIGDIVEVAGFGLTAKGKIREPRFVRVRHDKMVKV